MGRDRDALGREFHIARMKVFSGAPGADVDEPVDVMIGQRGDIHIIAQDERTPMLKSKLEAGGATLIKAAGGGVHDRASIHAEEKKASKADIMAPASWGGRPIAHPDHVHELDREAAIHEFSSKLPRSQAEDKAYGHYKRSQHSRAAAHHLLGMKAAQAVGDHGQAQKHGMLYSLHLRSMGHEPIGPVPEEVQRHANNYSDEKLYRFKPHHGDLFLFSDMPHEAKVEKALPSPAPIGAAAPAQGVRQSPLHGTVEGFMAGLKMLPQAGPERGKFITQHMNHAPFLAALQAHPQGAAVHKMLTQHLNSSANAGFKPGQTVATVKSERLADVYRAAKFILAVADLKKS